MAETRETQVLEDVIESTEIENPRTTEEAILAQVIAGNEVTINARTRLQKYLSQLTSGGSSVEVEPRTFTANGTYSTPNMAYSPVTVNVPNPNSKETLTGTLASVFANYSNVMGLVNAMVRGDADVYALFDFTSFGLGETFGPMFAQYNLSYRGSAFDTNGGSGIDFEWDNDGILTSALAVTFNDSSATITDLYEHASLIPTTVQIRWHTMST